MSRLLPARQTASLAFAPVSVDNRCRAGFTLIEMLVAMTLSLIIVLAVAQVFQMVGDNVLASRASLEMSGQLRAAANQLEADLTGLTVPVRPWTRAASGAGYFEIVEGPLWDMGLGTTAYADTSAGDMDDILMFTSRAQDGSFVGQIQGYVDTTVTPPRLVFNAAMRNTIESRIAEVAWFTRFNDRNLNGAPDRGEVTLHRRVFLVLPELDLTHPSIQSLPPGQFYSLFDLSAAIRPSVSSPGTWDKMANTLESLTQRENRTAHNVSGASPLDAAGTTILQPFPYVISRALLAPQGTGVTTGPDGQPGQAGIDDDGNGVTDDPGETGFFGTDDLAVSIDGLIPPLAPGMAIVAEPFGSDVVLSDVLAFDVKVYDQLVPVRANGTATESLLPGDPGYATAPVVAIGQGGYVDLFFNRYTAGGIASVFSASPHVKSGLVSASILASAPERHPSNYDTWTWFYEQDGVDQFGDGVVDTATNGLDDNNQFGADDELERETSPPYPVPLRGIQVRLRITDIDSRQVRQATVTSDFVPE